MTKDDRELIERLNAHSSKVPIGELRNDLRTAADTLATRLEALQAQPVGEAIADEAARMNRWAAQNAADAGDETAELKYRYAADEAGNIASAIRALTASPPVVEREAIAGEFVDNFRNAVGEDAWLSIPQYLQIWIMGKAGAVHLALSTPVAQGGEVRDALEPFAEIARGEAFRKFADDAKSSLVICNPDGKRFAFINAECFDVALATLTKGARDAG